MSYASKSSGTGSVGFAARLQRADLLLLFATLALGGVGILSIAVAEPDDRQRYVVGQAFGLVAGSTGMILLMLVNYQWLLRHLRFLYGLVVGMLLVVLAAGITVNGSRSWISVGPVQVQPSEFAKLLMIVVLAGYVSNNSFASNRTLLKALGIMAVPMLLVMAQPDLGTAMVFGAFFMAIIFVGGIRWHQLGAIFAATVVAIFAAIKLRILEEYQLARLTAFLDPQSTPDISYQVENSKMAIGSGGLTGRGFDASSTLSNLGYLPEDRTDFIFSVLAERLGFVGTMIVLLLFFLLIWRALHVATVALDRFGVLVAVGVSAMLTFHVLINVGMTMGMMPVTGLPLPFISYGRSNLMVSLLAMGIVQSIAIQSRLKQQGNLRI